MVPSLSIVLPVYNAEAMLAEQVCRLLEVLPDLAERFEILIVDDGSTDHTPEIVADLVQQFPQLRTLRQGRRRGAAAAIQTGMEQTSGEFVLVQDVHEPISPRSLRRLWDLRHDEDLVLARAEPQIKPLDASLLSKLMNWGRGVERASAERSTAERSTAERSTAERAPSSGTQLIRRAAVEELEANPSLQHLRLAHAHGAEKLARIVPRRKGTGLMTHLRDFALGE